MKMHPVAKLFPDMTTEQFKDLVEDIRKNGQLEPIVIYSDRIADGRHRFKACQKLNIDPRLVQWEDIRPDEDSSLVTYVISRNLRRRHLTKDQRTAIATDALPLFEQEAKHRQKLAAAKGGTKSKRGRTPKSQGENKVPADLREPYPDQPIEDTQVSDRHSDENAKTGNEESKRNRENESASKAAKQAGTSPRSVQRAKALGKKSKELLDLVKSGDIKLVLAEKLAELDPKHLELVLDGGRKSGDYKGEFDAFLDQYRPGSEQTLTEKEVAGKLRQATKQAKALNRTLAAAVEMTKVVKIQKGKGLIKLQELTKNANDLSHMIADK